MRIWRVVFAQTPGESVKPHESSGQREVGRIGVVRASKNGKSQVIDHLV